MVTPEHSDKVFDRELAELRTLTDEMGRLAINLVALSLDSLSHGNTRAVEKLARKHSMLDSLYREIEDRAAVTVAKRQPVAGDLRGIVGAIRIASDLERVGDLARNTARRGAAISELPKQLSDVILPLGEKALVELGHVLDAVKDLDSEAALSVWMRDEELDEQYNIIFQQLLNHMLNDPWSIAVCTHLQFIAKNFERVGDHATNIAESVCYCVGGRMPSGLRPKN